MNPAMVQYKKPKHSIAPQMDAHIVVLPVIKSDSLPKLNPSGSNLDAEFHKSH